MTISLRDGHNVTSLNFSTSLDAAAKNRLLALLRSPDVSVGDLTTRRSLVQQALGMHPSPNPFKYGDPVHKGIGIQIGIDEVLKDHTITGELSLALKQFDPLKVGELVHQLLVRK